MRRLFDEHLKRVEWDSSKFPVRLYPFLSDAAPSDGRPIVIDPRIAFGRPVVSARAFPHPLSPSGSTPERLSTMSPPTTILARRKSNRPSSMSGRLELCLFHRSRSRYALSRDSQAEGLTVERHADHFAHDTPDETWLEAVGKHGWIALTHDRRIRYKPNERDAVMRHGVALLVIVGTAPFPELARAFVATVRVIESFLHRRKPPFIAKSSAVAR